MMMLLMLRRNSLNLSLCTYCNIQHSMNLKLVYCNWILFQFIFFLPFSFLLYKFCSHPCTLACPSPTPTLPGIAFPFPLLTMLMWRFSGNSPSTRHRLPQSPMVNEYKIATAEMGSRTGNGRWLGEGDEWLTVYREIPILYAEKVYMQISQPLLLMSIVKSPSKHEKSKKCGANRVHFSFALHCAGDWGWQIAFYDWWRVILSCCNLRSIDALAFCICKGRQDAGYRSGKRELMLRQAICLTGLKAHEKRYSKKWKPHKDIMLER